MHKVYGIFVTKNSKSMRRKDAGYFLHKKDALGEAKSIPNSVVKELSFNDDTLKILIEQEEKLLSLYQEKTHNISTSLDNLYDLDSSCVL